MIKGVNHSIIEVSDTGSVYYDRAILVIRPEYASVQRDILENEARKILSEMGEPSSLKKGRSKAKKIMFFIGSALFGALLTSIFFIL